MLLNRSMSVMIRLHGRFVSRCACTNSASTRSNSARLATCVSGSCVAMSCRLWQRLFERDFRRDVVHQQRQRRRPMPAASTTGDGLHVDGERLAVATGDVQSSHPLHARSQRSRHRAIVVGDRPFVFVAQFQQRSARTIALPHALAGNARSSRSVPWFQHSHLCDASTKITRVVHVVDQLLLEQRSRPRPAPSDGCTSPRRHWPFARVAD